MELDMGAALQNSRSPCSEQQARFYYFYLCLDHGLDVPVGKFCCIWA